MNGVSLAEKDVFSMLVKAKLSVDENSDEYKAFRERVRGFEFSPCIRCGGCDNRLENCEDCFGNGAPTCGGCLWSEGIVTCP